MQLFLNAKYDFVGKIKLCLIISGVLIIAGWAVLFTKGPVWGLDFTGGNLLHLKFAGEPPIGRLRGLLENASIQRIGARQDNEVNIRIAQVFKNLNAVSEKELYDFLKKEDPLKGAAESGSSAAYRAIAGEVVQYRKAKGSIQEMAEIRELKGMTPALFDFFSRTMYCGQFGAAQGEEEAGELVKEEFTLRLRDVLLTPQQKDLSAKGTLDINATGRDAILRLLTEKNPLGKAGTEEDQAVYREVADSIQKYKAENGIVRDMAELQNLPGMTGELYQFFEKSAFCGPFAILGTEYVGPVVGAELKKRAIEAVLWAFAGMLVYIALRFQYQWGIAAVVAAVHDILITAGFMAIFRMEFTLTVIAAFLTLVGFSVNDTVVVFDRIRENQRIMRRETLSEVVNRSVNQTLSRTFLTSGTVLFVTLALFFFGGDVLHGMAFVLLVGIITGTYSSVYIASPLLILWERFRGKKQTKAR
jgi:preprotein translocase SecF subunit